MTKFDIAAWMNFGRELQTQYGLRRAIALPTVRSLIALALLLNVSGLPVAAVPVEQAIAASADRFAIAPKRFVDWCLNKANLTDETRHTVDVLLQKVGTQDCAQANNKLSNLTTLDLSSNRIADLKPLSSLTRLTGLYLADNRIANLKPLSFLTKLTELDLAGNRIADLKPLSSLTDLTLLRLNINGITDLKPLSFLTNLIVLNLGNNQIVSLKPLSSLTKLVFLNLVNNETLTTKTCPIKPASICKF